MSQHIRSIIILILAVVCGNVSASTLVHQADSAYEHENYKEAVDLYQQVAKNDGISSDLYYNMGNAYYRTGNIAQSILAYERALRLNPSNDDARKNLEFVNSRIIDKKGETGSFISNTIESITNIFHSNTWACLSLVLFILALSATGVYLYTSPIGLKKIGFFGGILLLLMTIASVCFAFKSKNIATDDRSAIITAKTTVLSTVPRKPLNREEEAMLLHEGTKVKIIRTIALSADSTNQTWHEVDVDNRHRAWINNSDIEKINP